MAEVVNKVTSAWPFWIILTVLLVVALFIYFSVHKDRGPDPEPDPVQKEEPVIRSSSKSSSNKVQEPESERRAA